MLVSEASSGRQDCLIGSRAYPVQLPQVRVDWPEGEDCVLCRHWAALPSTRALEDNSRALPQIHDGPHACEHIMCSVLKSIMMSCSDPRAPFLLLHYNLIDVCRMQIRP